MHSSPNSTSFSTSLSSTVLCNTTIHSTLLYRTPLYSLFSHLLFINLAIHLSICLSIKNCIYLSRSVYLSSIRFISYQCTCSHQHEHLRWLSARTVQRILRGHLGRKLVSVSTRQECTDCCTNIDYVCTISGAALNRPESS